MNIVDLNNFFKSSINISQTGDDPNNPAALPNCALEYLLQTCENLGVKSAFEFGSGRSTKALLSAGINLVSIEDSRQWLDSTLTTLPKSVLAKHLGVVMPLKLNWLGLTPMMDWSLTPELLAKLSDAELVLIDSPLYTGFRESTLMKTLSLPGTRLVVLDDLRIPGIKHFCERIAIQSHSLQYKRVLVGHEFAVFGTTQATRVSNRHSLFDIVRGWRRFIKYWRFRNQTS